MVRATAMPAPRYAVIDLTPVRITEVKSCFPPPAERTSFEQTARLIACLHRCLMSPRRYSVDNAKGVLDVEWPLFGEMARALALKVARSYDPQVIVGIATSGVIPGAVIAAIHNREFRAMTVTRRGDAEQVRETPHVLGSVPPQVRGKRVLVVDETCDTGDTLRLAVNAIINAGAAEVRSAVCFRTGPYAPDFHALATESTIVLPWDREILVEGDLVPNPLYAEALGDG